MPETSSKLNLLVSNKPSIHQHRQGQSGQTIRPGYSGCPWPWKHANHI